MDYPAEIRQRQESGAETTRIEEKCDGKLYPRSGEDCWLYEQSLFVQLGDWSVWTEQPCKCISGSSEQTGTTLRSVQK